MFRGRFEHTVDGKGRIALPAAVRRALSEDETLVITTHVSAPCLVAHPLRDWAEFESRLAQRPQFDPGVMMLRRLYVGSAMDCPIDRQGRVLLPAVLRDYAGIQREAYWVGAIRSLELWNPENWAQHVEAARQSISTDLLQKLSELGI
ncbi:MAG: division/cell wall cluster transcriptional repressor MraZ [Myxococcota bacterium]